MQGAKCSRAELPQCKAGAGSHAGLIAAGRLLMLYALCLTFQLAAAPVMSLLQHKLFLTH